MCLFDVFYHFSCNKYITCINIIIIIIKLILMRLLREAVSELLLLMEKCGRCKLVR